MLAEIATGICLLGLGVIVIALVSVGIVVATAIVESGVQLLERLGL